VAVAVSQQQGLVRALEENMVHMTLRKQQPAGAGGCSAGESGPADLYQTLHAFRTQRTSSSKKDDPNMPMKSLRELSPLSPMSPLHFVPTASDPHHSATADSETNGSTTEMFTQRGGGDRVEESGGGALKFPRLAHKGHLSSPPSQPASSLACLPPESHCQCLMTMGGRARHLAQLFERIPALHQVWHGIEGYWNVCTTISIMLFCPMF
jgi:hypothetical protein